jgi:hypothetical protein
MEVCRFGWETAKPRIVDSSVAPGYNSFDGFLENNQRLGQ